MNSLNSIHNQHLRRVESADLASADNPIQNLTFGSLRPVGSTGAFRIGVAIGDQVLDLEAFLEDGDTLVLRGRCEAEGAVPIGLGSAVGTVLP